MRTYSKLPTDNNTQLEREPDIEPRPIDLFARRLAIATGISILHANTALSANGVTGGRDV